MTDRPKVELTTRQTIVGLLLLFGLPLTYVGGGIWKGWAQTTFVMGMLLLAVALIIACIEVLNR